MDKKILRPSHKIHQMEIGDMIQSHPYEYLSKLNSIHSECNKANSTHQSFSSVSKVKLPWKSFKIINIPRHFQEKYVRSQQKENLNEICDQSSMDENEKKFWKEHEEIKRRYLAEKQQNKRPKSTKVENQQYIKKLLQKNKNNIFLKRILESGTKFPYDREQLEQEVLMKLKSLHKEQNSKRMPSAHELEKREPEKKLTGVWKPKTTLKKKEGKMKIPKEYLETVSGEELLNRYKKSIKEVDCSISTQNINKTMGIIARMQRRIKQLE